MNIILFGIKKSSPEFHQRKTKNLELKTRFPSFFSKMPHNYSTNISNRKQENHPKPTISNKILNLSCRQLGRSQYIPED